MKHEPLQSPRLDYRALDEAHLDAFQALIADAHVRRYLLGFMRCGQQPGVIGQTILFRLET